MSRLVAAETSFAGTSIDDAEYFTRSQNRARKNFGRIVALRKSYMKSDDHEREVAMEFDGDYSARSRCAPCLDDWMRKRPKAACEEIEC